jgi:acetamidase/formamidase
VKSGDSVEIQTLITSSPKRLEGAGVAADQVEQSLRDIYDQVKDKGPGGHILTGPIYIEDAQPGALFRCGWRFLMFTTGLGRDADFCRRIIRTRR